MKILIGILSCERDRQYHQLLLNTWLKDCPVDYVFILGKNQRPKLKNEIIVDAPDDYRSALLKVKRMIEYAVDNQYDYLFKCDVDTYCHVPRLLKSGFEKYDFSGGGGPYGGSGYWLSHKAMKILLEKNLDWSIPDAEDCWVMRNLKSLGIEAHYDARYHSLTNEGPSKQNDIIACHWYSERRKLRNGGTRHRIIHYEERLKLFPAYYEKAKSIKENI
jgi:hypothetical protein